MPACDLLVRGGHVLALDDAGTSGVADVVVVDGRIAALGPGAGDGWEAAEVVDAAGDAVLPGLVNCHAHELLERGVFEDLPFATWLHDFALPKDRAYAAADQRLAAQLCQLELIAAGCTTFLDIFRFPAESAAVAVESGVRAVLAPQVVEVDPDAGESVASAEAFLAEWSGRHPRVHAWLGPHAPLTVGAEGWKALRALADAAGPACRLHTHVAESEGEVAACLARGRTPVELLDELVGGLDAAVTVAHAVHVDDGDRRRLAAAGVGVAHCPASNAKLGNGFADVPALRAAGVVVGLGTDSPMTGNDLDVLEEARTAGLVAKGRTGDATALSVDELLRMATIDGARVLGLDGDIGSLEVGKAADLVVVDLDRPSAWPLLDGGANVAAQVVWSSSGRDVRATVCDGRVLWLDGEWRTLDVDAVRREAGPALGRLLDRAGVPWRR